MLAKVNRHVLPFFCCLAMLCYLDRVNLAFAARQLNEDLGFSKAVYGLGSGAHSRHSCNGMFSIQLCANSGLAAALSAHQLRCGCLPVFFSSCWIIHSWAVPSVGHRITAMQQPDQMPRTFPAISAKGRICGAADA